MKSHFLSQIQSGLRGWTTSTPNSRKVFSERIFRILETKSQSLFQEKIESPPSSSSSAYNKHLHEQVQLWNRILSSLPTLSSHTAPSLHIDEYLQVKNLPEQLETFQYQYVQNLQHKEAIFQSIKGHHKLIQTHGWGITAANAESLKNYGVAAVGIGDRSWVQLSHQWILQKLFSFYNKKGLQRELFHEYTANNRPFNGGAASDQEKAQQIFHLLDIGSCYDPLSKLIPLMNFNNLEITAIDIHPMNPFVYLCDFLDLTVSPTATLPLSTQQQQRLGLPSSSSFQRILALPPNSYHGISLALVLSYLPSPYLRYQMILKCYQLLFQPSSLMTLSYQPFNSFQRYGILVIVDTYHSMTSKNWISEQVEQEQKQEQEEEQDRHQVQEQDQGDVKDSNQRQNSPKELMNWLPLMGSIGFKLIKQEVIYNKPPILNAEVPTRIKLTKKASIGLFFRTMSPEEKIEYQKKFTRHYHCHSTRHHLGSYKSLSSSPHRHHPIGIIGAGIGGSALGYMLHQQGIPYLLFDRDENISSRPQGYAVTIQQGISVLRSIGIITNVVENKYNRNISSSSGHERMNSSPVVIPQCTISRSHLSFAYDGRLLGAFGPPTDSSRLNIPYHLSYPQGQFEFTNSHLPSNNLPVSSLESKNVRQNIHMPRKALRDTLLTHSNLDAIKWSHKLEDITLVESSTSSPSSSSPSSSSSPPHVTLRFDNQKEYSVSGLIGCDGIYSSVRRIYFDRYFSQQSTKLENLSQPQPHQQGSRYLNFHEKNLQDQLNFLGLFVILGISPRRDEMMNAVRRKVQWVDGRTRVFTMPYDDENDMWQMSFPMTTEEILQFQESCSSSTASFTSSSHRNYYSSQKLKEMALQQCDNWHTTLTEMLHRTDATLITGHPVYDRNPEDLVELRTRYQRFHLPITLAGDSWHPMSPFKAQGANQALLDAASLSKQITSWWKNQNTSLGSYLCAYESEAFGRSSKKVIKSRSAAQYLHSSVALTPGNVTRASLAEKASSSFSSE